MHSGIRADKWSLTLYLRRDRHFVSADEKLRAAESRRKFLADAVDWMRDQALMARLQAALGIDEADVSNARWKVRRAIESGELVTIPDTRGSGLSGSGGSDMPRLPSVTFTPSQLFRRASPIPAVRSYERPAPIRLFADDCMAAWRAEPGDRLPDGRIARAIGSVRDDKDGGDSVGEGLADAEPFEYGAENASDDDSFDVAARGVGLTGNEPGGFRINANGLDVDYFDGDGNLCAQYHESHGDAHGHNFDGAVRDNAHLPMSPINPR
ncbi:hypothetical protein [Caballeronia sp. Sq4a]|uniref:hypothetical protein n=1 Tax=Caballeronia sp. Sq4a TaxID=2878152 RepID=UPI0020C0AE8A|nr:hypothetical protein [Caballeronia sp. Sq4a]